MPVCREILDKQRLFGQGMLLHVRVFAAPGAEKTPGIPVFQDGMGLVDTGATLTCLSNDVAKALGYTPVDYADCPDPSGTSKKPVYPLHFEFPGSKIAPLRNLPGVGVDLSWQPGMIMLIGRDILSAGHLVYNGPSGSWYLELPAPARDVTQLSYLDRHVSPKAPQPQGLKDRSRDKLAKASRKKNRKKK